MLKNTMMLRSWESDGNQVVSETERTHYTLKGVHRRIRRLQGRGLYGHGECPDGSYVVAVEQIPHSWGQ